MGQIAKGNEKVSVAVCICSKDGSVNPAAFFCLCFEWLCMQTKNARSWSEQPDPDSRGFARSNRGRAINTTTTDFRCYRIGSHLRQERTEYNYSYLRASTGSSSEARMAG